VKGLFVGIAEHFPRGAILPKADALVREKNRLKGGFREQAVVLILLFQVTQGLSLSCWNLQGQGGKLLT